MFRGVCNRSDISLIDNNPRSSVIDTKCIPLVDLRLSECIVNNKNKNIISSRVTVYRIFNKTNSGYSDELQIKFYNTVTLKSFKSSFSL